MKLLTLKLFAVAVLCAPLLGADGTSDRRTHHELPTCVRNLSDLRDGVPIKVLFVLTHQIEDLVDLTITRLAYNPRYKDMVVVVLNHPRDIGPAAFNAFNPEEYPQLRGRTHEFISVAGEPPKEIRMIAETMHVAGGACGACLTLTLGGLILQFLASDLAEIRFVVHRSLVYPPIMDTDTLLQNLFLGRRIKPIEDLPNPHSPFSSFAEVLLRDTDKKRVFVEIVP